MSNITPALNEQPCEVCTGRRSLSVGLPANSGGNERRFPLTPEAVALLVDKGLHVRIEAGAAASIHYADTDYIKAGAEVVARDETLRCDIVVCLSALSAADIRSMRRGIMLLTQYQSYAGNRDAISALLHQSVITISLDLVEDSRGNKPFADILEEIDGRASIAVASALQTDPVDGKGILMGGVAGIVPCEITILGSGIAACAAARSATGLGAMVRMFDNDVYRLRSAMQHLGASVIGSALHPHVLEGALRSADVVIATPMRHPIVVGSELVDMMKRKVIVIDVSEVAGQVFPSLPVVNLAAGRFMPAAGRRCCVNVSGWVPRTAAMAVSNALVTMFDDILSGTVRDSAADMVKMLPGIRPAIMSLFGKIVNARIASSVGMRSTDLSIYLSLS